MQSELFQIRLPLGLNRSGFHAFPCSRPGPGKPGVMLPRYPEQEMLHEPWTVGYGKDTVASKH